MLKNFFQPLVITTPNLKATAKSLDICYNYTPLLGTKIFYQFHFAAVAYCHSNSGLKQPNCIKSGGGKSKAVGRVAFHLDASGQTLQNPFPCHFLLLEAAGIS